MITACMAYGQTTDVSKLSSTLPAFNNINYESIEEFLEWKINYPKVSYISGLQGTEVIRFDITSSGEITNLRVVNSVSPEIDEEVINVLNSTSGYWIPCYLNGNPARMQKEVSMVFKLNPLVDFDELVKHDLIRASRLLYQKEKPERALRILDRALNYLPDEEAIHLMRAQCKIKVIRKSKCMELPQQSQFLCLHISVGR